MWTKEQVDGMRKILEIQGQLRISNLDLVVYDQLVYMVNSTEECMDVDIDDACEELVDLCTVDYDEDLLRTIMKENWENPEVFENGI